MRSFFSALVALAALATIGIFGGTAAQAGWKQQVLGPFAAGPQTRSIVARQKARQTKRRARRTSAAKRSSVSRRRKARRSAPRGRKLSGLASYYWQPQRVASGGWFTLKYRRQAIAVFTSHSSPLLSG